MFDLEPHEARLLLDVAMMAIGQNRFETAAKMLVVLKAYRPKSEPLAIAEVLLLMSRGALEEALTFLEREEQADRFPESAMLMTFKGLALLKAGRPQEAKAVLERAAVNKQNPVAARMAKDLLE